MIDTYKLNFDELSANFSWPTLYQEFVYTRTYSRWIEKEERRETWVESIKRYYNFFIDKVPEHKLMEFNNAILNVINLNVMPSMRALWTAGPALERENLCGFNCSYLQIDNVKAFGEMLYALMCGCGVGYSVERQYIVKLPEVPAKLVNIDDVIKVKDSKKGWAKSLTEYIKGLYDGKIYKVDYSDIRPAGSRLKTFGGRASGPEPFKDLINFITNVFKQSSGRKLNSIELFDICCKIPEVVVCGGSRRAACICFTNLSDERMRHAKDGEFWLTAPWRAYANISVAYTEKPAPEILMKEWIALIRSKAGERGIFNAEGVKANVVKNNGRNPNADYRANPCVEAVLKSEELCNLSEVVIREGDTLNILKEKVRHATILGCLQATLTNFNFLNRNWRKNCEEERLLGVSLTGLADHDVLSKRSTKAREWLFALKEEANITAKEWCKALEINDSRQVTLLKPSGTCSQLVDSSSGLHPRYSQYYIRRIRVDRMDPISKLLIDKGIPYNPENGQKLDTCNTYVFEFPCKSPYKARLRDEFDAWQQLEYWKMLKEVWSDGNPSCTIYVKEHEWIKVLAWIYDNWEQIGGLSFLPYDAGIYKLAPYEEIDEDRYNELVAKMPIINFNELTSYEKEDETIGAKEYACTGNACEL